MNNFTCDLFAPAASVDAATERIIRFLNEGFGVPINVVFFRHFEDNGTTYLVRTWLVDHDGQQSTATAPARQTKNREPWNDTDWYVSFGEDSYTRQWADARKYGFVSGGGGKRFSQKLKNLPVGARVFVHTPKAGYVGVGTVAGEACRFDQLRVEVDGVTHLVTDLPLAGSCTHNDDADDENAEWAVPIS